MTKYYIINHKSLNNQNQIYQFCPILNLYFKFQSDIHPFIHQFSTPSNPTIIFPDDYVNLTITQINTSITNPF